MTAKGTTFWLSVRSWIVGRGGVLQRIAKDGIATGVARLGTEQMASITAQRSDRPRTMYEVLTAGTYAVLDGGARVATLHGPMRVQDLADHVWKGEELHVEDYAGAMRASPWERTWLRAAPHQNHLPHAVLERVMDRQLAGGTRDVTVPRAIFAQLRWLLSPGPRHAEASASLHVDHKTFPTAVTVVAEDARSKKVIAVTRFEETQPWEVLSSEAAWRIVCDGLILG